ncbi:MAG: ATPase, T2SS/T4P/T4SS family [Clostridiaceae bacterium]|nr:ATPase, T2SS/T4P/T4SS family [Clostridiaceae bacterium]
MMLFDAETRQKLSAMVMQQIGDLTDIDDDGLKRLALKVVAAEYSGSRLSFHDRQFIANRLFDSMRGLDLLQSLMDDPEITEIMVNGPYCIFYEKNGQLFPSDLKFDNVQHLSGVITNFFGRANRMIHEKNPLADMRLPDGSRVHAALPPSAPDGPVLTIRKFTGIKPDMHSLIEHDFISQPAANYLVEQIERKQSIFICGGTGTGKTTFLNILSNFIPSSERVITIEDAAELALQNLPNTVRLESRAAGPDGSGEISLADLIRASLRMRPDRIIVGEVRGREAFDMLQAMNTGHPGSLCTGHANSCQDMLSRLTLMVLMAVQLPWEAIRELIGSTLDIMVHLRRTLTGKREIDEICSLSTTEGQIQIHPLFIRSKGGILVHAESNRT